MKTARRRAARAKLPQHCAHCGATEGLTLDHIMPRVYGGTNMQENLQLLCPPCNVEKSKKKIRHCHTRANEKAGERLRHGLAARFTKSQPFPRLGPREAGR